MPYQFTKLNTEATSVCPTTLADQPQSTSPNQIGKASLAIIATPSSDNQFIHLDETRKATLLQRFCLITIGLQVVLVVLSTGAALAEGERLPLPSLVSGAIGIGFAWWCYHLSRTGHHRLGSWLLILSQVLPFALAYAVIGTSVPFMLVFLLPISLAIVLLSPPEVVIIGGACLVYSFGLHLLQDFLGLYQPALLPFAANGGTQSADEFARTSTAFIELLFVPVCGLLILTNQNWQRRTLLAQNRKLHLALEEIAHAQSQTSQVSQQVLTLAAQLSGSASQQSTQSQQQLGTVTEINTSLTQLSHAAINISELAYQVDEVAAQVSSNNHTIEQTVGAGLIQARQGLNKVEQTVEVSHQVSHLYQQLTATMQELTSKGVRMRRILELLSGIAAETHLLSLNAAIEAAGAAQHGERFGVVAQEIKQLAQRSSRASEEVVGIIQEIEEATAEAQTLAQTGQLKAHELQRVAQQTGEVFSEVQLMTAQCEVQATSTSEVAAQVKQLTQVIRTATAQQRSANQQVLEALEGLSGAALQSSQSSKLVSSSAFDLQSLSQTLQLSLK